MFFLNRRKHSRTRLKLSNGLCLLLSLLTLPVIADMDNSNDSQIKLYTLDCGFVLIPDLDMFDKDGGLKGKSADTMVTCYVIKHPKGYFLWNTGLPDTWSGKGEMVGFGGMVATVSNTLIGQLAELGLQPSDIDYLGFSHGHLDHAGNANLFTSSHWLVNPVERESISPANYEKKSEEVPDYLVGLDQAKWTATTDNYDVFDDGSVIIMDTPGHTLGHQSLLLRLKNAGSLLFSGDLYHITQSRSDKLVPSYNEDHKATSQSMEKFEALAIKENARVIIEHEVADFDFLPKFPAYLD